MYEVEDLTSDRVLSVHAERLKFYADSELEVTEELVNLISHDGSGFEVQEILSWRRQNDEYQCLVHWLGLEDVEESWEPLTTLWEDIPNVVRAWFRTLPPLENVQAMMASVGYRPL